MQAHPARVSPTASARHPKSDSKDSFAEGIKQPNSQSRVSFGSGNCTRCGGLVVKEYMDPGLLVGEAFIAVQAHRFQWRCVACGDIWSLAIEANRRKAAAEMQNKTKSPIKNRGPQLRQGRKLAGVSMNEDRSVKDLLGTIRVDLNSRGKLNEDPDE